MGPDGARNQERLCWRGPAAIYLNWTGLVKRCDSNEVEFWDELKIIIRNISLVYEHEPTLISYFKRYSFLKLLGTVLLC
jgi:hypothetical protein